MKILEEQRVLITGAGSGIGKVMAEHFEKSGARIWICDANEKILGQCLQENPTWQGAHCDVSDEHSVNASRHRRALRERIYKPMSIT